MRRSAVVVRYDGAMSEELIPSPDLAPPPIPDSTSFQERLDLWVDLMNACEQFLLAGLRREIGPDGDLKAARANGLMTAFVARPTEYGPHQKRDFKADEAWTHVVDSFNQLADQLGC